MAVENFQASLKRVLVHEGGYSNHPADPGGATMKGVTKAVYDAFRERVGLPKQDVRRISADELAAIYRMQYADRVQFDRLPIGLDYVVFDGAVHSGPAQSIKWLQRALQPLYGGAIDGVLGNATLRAIQLVKDVDALIAAVCDRREAFLQALRTFKTFGAGWTRRVAQVGDAGQDWASGSVPSDRDLFYEAGMEAKALVADAALPKSPVTAATAGAGAASAATAFEIVRQMIEGARGQVSQFAGASAAIDTVLTVLTVASLAAGLGGVVYGVWASRRAGAINEAIDLDAAAAT